ncbi:MAG: sugar-phosphatase [Peptostreptococcaceae bacterium]
MYKILATDMDGTILNSDKEITKEVYDAVQDAKKQGKKIVLATGRPLPGVTKYLEELHLNEEGDYVICFNGALVQEVKTKKVLSNIEMTFSDFEKIQNLANKHNMGIHINTPTEIVIPYETPNEYSVREATINGLDIVSKTMEDIKENVTFCKVMVIDSPEALEEFIPKIPSEMHEEFNIVRSAPFFLEFLHKDANKGVALRTLCNHLGYSIDEAIAVGDEENDKHMIEYAGLGVAMDNARDSIKELANHITTNNNDSGVAKVIKEFLLK